MTQAKEATEPASKPLPAGWKWAKVGEVCDLIGGGTPSKLVESYYSGNIPWATVRDMSEDVLAITEHRITKEAVSASATHVIPKGNVVIATRVGLGKVCLLAQDTAINQDLKGVLPHKNSSLDVGYLFHWFKSVSDQIMRQGTGATVLGVKLPFIESLKIPIPPLPEQKRIAAKINDQMAAVEKARAAAEAQLEAAKALPAAYLRQVFPSPGQPLPSGWKFVRLGDVCDAIRGVTFSAAEGIPQLAPRYVACLTTSAVQDTLDWESRRYIPISRVNNQDQYLKENDLLVSTANSKELVGKYCRVVDLKEPVVFGAFVTSLRPKGITPELLGYIFQRKDTRDFCYEKSSHTTGISNLRVSDLLEFAIPLPSLSVQNKIVSELNVLFSAASKLQCNLEDQLDQINSLPASILRKAFSGDL